MKNASTRRHKAQNKANSKVNAMWGGQYARGPAAAMERINPSIGYDKKLYNQDIMGSVAHVNMLEKQQIISKRDTAAIRKGLATIKKEIDSGRFVFHRELEDIHMNIEARLKELIGESAGKLHTARSRNDQVATAFRLWVSDGINSLDTLLKDLQATLIERAEENSATIMPGFTHLQSAQPVTLGHHLMAYVEMFGRDRSRLKDAQTRMNECPLGAAALAGTSFPIDRKATARELGFSTPMTNSLDAVSDRDFALEFLNAASICATHLSRLAEELVLWSTPQFGFIRMSDAFTTGSSIMPQKKNPDAAELVRGKTGRITAQFSNLVMTMKSLPLAYNKDMQEDKEPVFEAHEQLSLCLQTMTGMIQDLTVNKEAMEQAASAGYSTATDLADWLVKNLKIPFRDAHHVTAKIVHAADKKNIPLHEVPLEIMQKQEPRITDNVYSVLSVKKSVASRKSFGGTAPTTVRRAVKAAKKKYL